MVDTLQESLIIKKKMNMKKKILASIAILGLLYSCANYIENKDDVSDSREESIRNMRELLGTPVHLRSAEGKALLHRMGTVVYDRFIIQNERFEITINQEEWVKMGLKEEYYDMVVKDFEDINNFLDTTSVYKQLTLDSWEESKNEFREKAKEDS